MFRVFAACFLTTAIAISIASPAHAQNADNGKTVFKQICSLCHEALPDRNRVGPTLFGVVGRKAGTVPGFHYSDQNIASGLTWDPATLDRYIANPRGVVPGTKMAYGGLKDDQKRQDLIAYLATLH